MNAILVFFVALFLCLVFPFLAGNAKTFIVLSGSMAPITMSGDMIIVNTINPDDLKAVSYTHLTLPTNREV